MRMIKYLLIFILLCTHVLAGELQKLIDDKVIKLSVSVDDEKSSVLEQKTINIVAVFPENMDVSFSVFKVNTSGGLSSVVSDRGYFNQTNGYKELTKNFFFYPQRFGAVAVNSVEINLTYNTKSGRESLLYSLPGPKLDVARPSSRYQLALSNPQFDVSYDVDLENIQVGQAFNISYRVTYNKSSVAFFPVIRLQNQESVDFYYQNESKEDKYDRGEITSVIEERVTVVVNRPGQFTIKAPQINVYNVDTDEIESIDFEQIEIDVDGFYLSKNVVFIISLVLLMLFTLWYIYHVNKAVIKRLVNRVLEKYRFRIELKKVVKSRDVNLLINFLYRYGLKIEEETIKATILKEDFESNISAILANLYNNTENNKAVDWKSVKNLRLKSSQMPEDSVNIGNLN